MTDLTIKVDRKKAILRWTPFWGVLFLWSLFALYTESLDAPECERLWGFNVAYLNLLLVTYVVPACLFIGSIAVAYRGYKEARYGYSPPLDSVAFAKEKEVKSGKWIKLRGILLMLAPLYGVYLVYIGHHAYSQITADQSHQQIIEKMESECTQQSNVP